MSYPETWGYQPSEHYGVTGGNGTTSYIAWGCVDFHCPTAHNEPASLMRILDARKGGYFLICPQGLDLNEDVTYNHVENVLRMTQDTIACEVDYVKNTNILRTRWTQGKGEAVVHDFAPVASLDSFGDDYQARPGNTWRDADGGYTYGHVRVVECTLGEITLTIRAKITPDFANPELRRDIYPLEGGFRISAGLQHFGLATTGLSSQDLHIMYNAETSQEEAIEGTITLREGQQIVLALGTGRNAEAVKAMLREMPSISEWGGLLEGVADLWRAWAEKCTYDGPDREAVVRSLLALKLCQFPQTGAFVAAPITSIPGGYGTARCWDYRYPWLRDMWLTLMANLRGRRYRNEVAGGLQWMTTLPTVGKGDDEHWQLMYTVKGQLQLPEETRKYLEGYMESRPVRIGNEAADQLQLDSYGFVLKGFLEFLRAGGFEQYPHLLQPALSGLEMTARYVCNNWGKPDNSPWEFRKVDEIRHYTIGKVMCWVALDCGIQFVDELHEQHPDLLSNVILPNRKNVKVWMQQRRLLRQQIEEKAYDPQRGVFTWAYGEDAMDASLLLMVLMGFIDANDPRMKRTVKEIQKELSMPGGYLRRYRSDGMEGREAAFLICTGWLAQVLAMQGEIDQARMYQRRIVRAASPLGLLSEQFDPHIQSQTGNFPQAFSHLIVVLVAHTLWEVKEKTARN